MVLRYFATLANWLLTPGGGARRRGGRAPELDAETGIGARNVAPPISICFASCWSSGD